MSATAVTALHVDDEDFVVASLIERCPKVMMIRELMMPLKPLDSRQKGKG
jgi:hypothetical protein